MQKKLSIILVFLLISNLLFAGTTGKIMGTVIDKETGEPIVGANIYLEGASVGSVSGMSGDYYIINIPPGTYNAVCSFIGYAKVTVTGVVVNIDRTTHQNFEISPEAIQGEEVIVTGARKLIEKDRTNTAAYVSSENIEKMPVQELGDLIQLQSGVVRDASGSFHIRGGRSGEIAYMIDGVSVTDQYNGGSSIGLENNWVQELQVISGTFNAEYGQAQSGVINIVTKEGAKKFSGSLKLSLGDYVTDGQGIYSNLDKLQISEKDISGNMQGPIGFLPKGSFYSSLRYFQSDGYHYGQRRIKIEDTVPIQYYVNEVSKSQNPDALRYGIEIPDSLMSGDGSYVPMDVDEKISLYTKVSTNLLNNLKLKYSLFYNTKENKNYSDYYRYSPDGVGTYYDDNYNHIISLNHVLSNSTFYTVNFSSYMKTTQFYLFDDPLDSLYQGGPHSDNSFAFGGTQKNRYKIKRAASTAKIDFTSQVNKYNQVKFGMEFKQHNLDYNTSSTVAAGVNYEKPDSLYIPKRNTTGNNKYVVKPIEASAYIQNKLEFNELIVNAGVRFDYWNPNAVLPANLRAETNPQDGLRLDTEYIDSEVMTQISPRFGLAYPISADGVVHVSYGHFFQIPRFNAIYNNYEYEIELGGLETKMGNVNLKPEKTVAYEIGLQQSFAGLFKMNVTLYYKDISNLLSQEIINTADKKVYARYINRDYGNVKGLTFSLNTASTGMISGGIEYTYQVAKGNASDPNAVFVNFQSDPPKEGEKQVVPLDWDQTHTLNGSVTFSFANGLNIGAIGRFATGQPYTPSNPGSELTDQFENSDRKPSTYNIDLNIYKMFKLADKYRVKLFCKVFNLTDHFNQRYVYASTGNAEAPYRTYDQLNVLLNNPNFSLEEIDLRPDFYSSPRKIVLGCEFNF